MFDPLVLSVCPSRSKRVLASPRRTRAWLASPLNAWGFPRMKVAEGRSELVASPLGCLMRGRRHRPSPVEVTTLEMHLGEHPLSLARVLAEASPRRELQASLQPLDSPAVLSLGLVRDPVVS